MWTGTNRAWLLVCLLSIAPDELECSDAVTIEVKKKTTISCAMSYEGPNPPTITLKEEGTAVDGFTPDDDPNADSPKKKNGSVEITGTVSGVRTFNCEAPDSKPKKCDIVVTVQTLIISTQPAVKTTALEHSATTISCTVNDKNKQTYTSVEWKYNDGADAICTSKNTKEDASDTCKEKSRYKMDATSKHDLQVLNVTAETFGKYSCHVIGLAAGLTETHDGELISVKGAPTCDKTEDNTNLRCTVEYMGTEVPDVHWYKEGDDDPIPPIITGDTKTTGRATWNTHEIQIKVPECDNIYKDYICKILKTAKGEVLEKCTGHNSASGFGSKLYQSWLLSLVVVWFWYKVL